MRRARLRRTATGAQPALAGTTGEAWRARPALATAIGVLALCGPVALSAAVVYVASRAIVPPVGSRALTIAWWAALSGVATVSLVVAGRLARRLLPLATLIRLSLVFPDAAPSRFRVALQTGTVDALDQRLADARSDAAGRTPVQSARLLLELVAHLDEHDPLTRGHSERVRAYAQSIGRELGLDPRELDLLNWAALLHDVGKLDVPHEILTKPGRPTEGEWESLRRHPDAGVQLAAPLAGWLGEWSGAIGQHHERWDGTGYPRGLAGDEISLAGRIAAVADTFDVITSSRTYKRPASIAEARRELSRCAGTQFDPDVVRAFLAISVRQSRLAAPLAWVTQAAVLTRLPRTQTASSLSAGAVAAVAIGTGAGTWVQTHPPEPAVSASVVRPAARVAAQPVAVEPKRPRPASTAAKKKLKAKAKPNPRTRTRTARAPTPRSAPKAETTAAEPEPQPPPTRPAPPASLLETKPRTLSTKPASRPKSQTPLETKPRTPSTKAASPPGSPVPPVSPPPTPPSVPPPSATEPPPLPPPPTSDGSPTDDVDDDEDDSSDDDDDDEDDD